MSIKGFKLTDNSVEQYDYDYLDNIPIPDITLTSPTLSAQARIVGNAIIAFGTTIISNVSWVRKSISVSNNSISFSDSTIRLTSKQIGAGSHYILAKAGYEFRIILGDASYTSPWVTVYNFENNIQKSFYINVRKANGNTILPYEGEENIIINTLSIAENALYDTITYKPNIYYGGINGNTGEIFDNVTNRAYTDFIYFSPRTSLIIPSGYKIRISNYDINENYINSTNWITDQYKILELTRARVMIGNNDDSELNLETVIEDFNNVIISYSDFKRLESKIDYLKDTINENHVDINENRIDIDKNYAAITHPVTIELGGINSVGTSFSSTNRAITSLMILVPNIIINVPSGYKIRPYIYNIDGSYINAGGWITNQYKATAITRVRFMIGTIDDAILNIEQVRTDFADILISYFDFEKWNDTFEQDRECFNDIRTIPDAMSGVYFWNYPRVEYISNELGKWATFGYVSEHGRSGIGICNLISNTIQLNDLFSSQKDDHDDMTVYYNNITHKLLAFGFKHSAENFIRVYCSITCKKPLMFERYDDIFFPGNVTYAQVFRDTISNKLVLFTRVDVRSWYVTYSTDETGLSWEEPELVFSTNSINNGVQLYILIRPTTTVNLYVCAVYGNPHWSTYSDSRIRLCFLNIATKKIYSSDGVTLLGQFGTGIDYSELPIILNCDYNTTLTSGDTTLRLYDLCPNQPINKPCILYGKNIYGTRSESKYYIYRDGISIEICDGGYAMYGAGDLTEGICFIGSDIDNLILGRKLSQISNTGFSVLEKWSYNNGLYTKIDEIDRSYSENNLSRVIRPCTDEQGNILFYQNGKCYQSENDPYSYIAKIIQMT